MLSLFFLFFPQSAWAAIEIHRGETQKRHKLPLMSGRVSNIIYLNYSSTTFGNAPGKGEVYIATYAPVLFLFIKTQLADSIFTLLMSLVQSCSCPLALSTDVPEVVGTRRGRLEESL